MKKRTFILLCQICLLASCTRGGTGIDSSNTGDSSNDSSNSQVSSTDNTINDAQGSESRPNYGSDFDYDSDYSPESPDDAVTKVTATLAENTTLTFKNGTKSMEVDSNYLFKEDDFDLTKISADRKLGGFALYMTEGNEYKGAFSLGELRAPKKDITLRPFFDAKTGFTAVDITKSGSKFNYDQVPGTISENQTVVCNSDVLIDGGTDGYTEKGASFVETSSVGINSALRRDIKFTVEDGVYEFTYNFANLGTSAIHFDFYQISASAEYKGKKDYENRYRIDIDLQPGESKTYSSQYLLGANSNFLVYFIADRTMPNGFSLGMSMAAKKTALTEVDSKYAPTVEEAVKGKVRLQLPSGISVSGYEEEQTAGQPIAIPEDSAITNTTGKKIGGWYIVGDSIKFITSSTVVSDIEEYTIAPYFVPETGTALLPGTNSDHTLPDYQGHTDEEGKLVDANQDFATFQGKNLVTDTNIGKNFTSDYEFAKGDFFRLITSSNVEAKGNYRFHYTLKNNLTTALSFIVYQVQSQITITPESGAVSKTVTVAPGATQTFDIEVQMLSKNSNVMSLFVFDAPSKGLDMDVFISQEKFTPVKTSTVTISGNSGVTFQDGTTSKSLQAGEKLPEIKNTTGRNLLGFYDDEGNTYLVDELDSFEMPAEDVALHPYFGVADGYTALDIGSGANSKFNFDKVPGSITENQTIVYKSGVMVEGGENGFTQKGVSFVETSRVDINSGIRLDSKANIDTAGVYEFVYNFSNLGTAALHFDVYQIAASSEYKGKTDYEKRYRMDVDLQPGESISYTAQYSLTKNGNAITYMVADRTMKDGFSLGMTMAFKKTELSEVDSKYVSQPEEAPKGKVKLQLPSGISVSGYQEEQTAGQAIAIPEASTITNTTGKTIAGWYIVGEPVRYVTSTTAVNDIDEYTIAPYFAPENGKALVPGTSIKNNAVADLPDYQGHTTDGKLVSGNDFTFKAQDTIVGDVAGRRFISENEFVKGDFFRLLMAGRVEANSTHKFHFTLKNNLTTAVSLTVYQVQGSYKIAQSDGAVSHSIKLAAGATAEFDIEITIQNANDNVMTVFVFDEASTGLDLDVAMSIADVAK